MENNNVFIFDWTQKSEMLLEKVEQCFDKIGLDKSVLPSSIYKEGESISLVFAGQYSAGKSSIIKALTKNETIEIGGGITTQITHKYNWNGLEIIDTPGIHTQHRFDHDEIAYDAIAKADILVYVVTQELFDDFIGTNFRKILIEKDKAVEMILIVNKMADVGNTPENRANKLEDLRKVTKPYSPESLNTCFVDAESYLDSLNETDQELFEEFFERSNYVGLKETINKFVEKNALSSKLTTAIYQIEDILQKERSRLLPATDDDDINALEEHQIQTKSMLNDSKYQLDTQVKRICGENVLKIKQIGNETASRIFDCSNQNAAQLVLDNALFDVQNIIVECKEVINNKIIELKQNSELEINEFLNNAFSKKINIRLSEKEKNDNQYLNKILKSEVLLNTVNMVRGSTYGANITNGLKTFSGSVAHQNVLKVGHFFKKTFKPYEALKVVKGINVATKFIGVTQIIASIGMQLKEDIDESNNCKEIKRERENIIAAFNQSAKELESEVYAHLTSFIEDYYNPQIDEINSIISEIRNLSQNKSENYKSLENLILDCQKLINDIHMKN